MSEEKEKIYWTMKNGEKIDVDEMTESHLRNTLKLILRRRKEQETYMNRINSVDYSPYHDDWRYINS